MRKKRITDKIINTKGERVFDILRSSVGSEKATKSISNNQYLFKVSKCSTKLEIKTAVEFIFKVNVKSVNTINYSGKVKKVKGKKGVRSSYKRAYIRIEKGQNIDFGFERS
jgi:large subunit ribosomal protein L23